LLKAALHTNKLDVVSRYLLQLVRCVRIRCTVLTSLTLWFESRDNCHMMVDTSAYSVAYSYLLLVDASKHL
jgi:hypothetical protein